MIGYFARHPVAANLTMIAIFVIGLAAYPALKRATFPDLKNDTVEITVAYPGATAVEIEGAICARIEDALEGTVDLVETQCDSRENIAIATAEMEETGDIVRFLDDVSSAIDGIDDFPDDIEKPVVREVGRTEFVASVMVTGPRSPTDLKALAEDIKDRVIRAGVASKVTIGGFSDRQIRISVSAARLRAYGLSVSELADRIGRLSIGQPVGLIEGGNGDFLLRIDDERTDVRAFADLVVVTSDAGANIRLGDIATVTDLFDRPEDMVLFNGRRAAVLDVEKTKAEDTLDVADAIAAFVAAERKRLPAGAEIDVARDSATIVRNRLNLLLRNGAQGLVLVFLVLWLFFSLRFSFWVAMGLPVSFLGAIAAMWLIGYSINMLTMVGLLVAIGLLMDDAIVISENIAVHLRRGENRIKSAVNGTLEVLPGVAASFITTMFVFGALAFISGDIGQILRVIPVVLIFTLAVSLIEAFLILPNHLSHSLHHASTRQSRFRSAFDKGFQRYGVGIFGRLADLAVRWRYLTLGLSFLLLLLTLALPAGGFLKFVAFPEIDGDIVEARLILPQGTPLGRTQAAVAAIDAGIAAVDAEFTPRQPDGQKLVKAVTVLYGQNPDAFETGPHVVRVIVDLLSAELRTGTTDDIIALWRRETGEIADAISLKFTESTIGPGGRAIDLRLSGDDLDQLKSAALEFKSYLAGFKGVFDLSDDLRPGKPEVTITLKDGAGALGFDSRMIAQQLQAAFQGVKVDDLQIGPESYEIEVRTMAGARDELADLDRFTLIGPGGDLVPLEAVATIEQRRSWGRINRVNGRRAVGIIGDVDGRIANANEIVGEAQAQFLPDLIARYPGIDYAVEGQNKEGAVTSASILRNISFGLIGVYLLLAFQFRGYFAPVIVMVVIPSSVVGAFLGHWLTGLNLSMPSIVGVASLAGVVVNNSILLVQFMDGARARGASAAEAAGEATRRRFRPIVLTTATTVAGLIPLLSETSLQAQVLIPLATSLAYGLAVASIISVLVVPAVYCIFDDLGLRRLEEDEDDGVTAESGAAALPSG